MNTHRKQCTISDAQPMTLIEIVVAMAILAFGMMGIMAVVPHAIRDTTSNLHKSAAGSVAETVAVSLKHYYLDLSMVDEGVPWEDELSEKFDTGSYPICIPADTTSSIPWDNAVPFPDTHSSSSDVADYNWTATIQEPDTEVYPIQIAVWRKYQKRDTSPTEKYETGHTLKIGTVDGTVQMGDYVCAEDFREWRKIADVSEDEQTITLSEPFSMGPIKEDSTIYIANDLDLISVYCTSIPNL